MALLQPLARHENVAGSMTAEKDDGLTRRILWLKTVVAGSFLVEMLLSWRLWSGERQFPKLPLLEFLPVASGPADTVVFMLLMGLLLAIMIHPKPRVLIYLVLLLVALLAVADQVRWHPFFYQYYFMFAALAFFAWSSKPQLGLITCRWIMVGLYFYAGLQKANIYFVGEVFPWFVEPLTRAIPATETFFLLAGFIAPFAEMGIAIGLLLKGFRPFAVVLACVMHLFILLCLGPLGHSWGVIVWPWNVSMVVLLFILFWRVQPRSMPVVTLKEHLFHKGILSLFVVMPLLSFFNLWDSYLSASLYSGTVNYADLHISKSLEENLPAELQPFVTLQDDTLLFRYDSWAHVELGTLLPPETRLFKQVALYLCGYSSQDSDIRLVIYGRKLPFRSSEPTTYTCSSLGFS